MLTRLIARTPNFRGLALTDDDELDAALALCGEIDLPLDTRYCFQTTYLNQRYPEYSTLGPDHRLIWVVRNPKSVIYSMVYNWRRFALNELYEGCGLALANSPRLQNSRWPWPAGPSRVEKACLSYAAKTAQIEEILRLVPREHVFVVDYDALVTAPQTWLPHIFSFIGEPYDHRYAKSVRSTSLGKARLSRNDACLVSEIAQPVYERCLRLVPRGDL
jgi:hypothetical protein